MKKLLCILLALFMLCGVTACGERSENESLRRIFAPVVKVSKSGVATWTDLEGAKEFVYKINGGKEVTTSKRSVQLNLNDVIEVKCLGDNVTTRSSRWGRGQYIPRHSFVYNNGGTAGNEVNIYKPDGTIVLDTVGGTKEHGDVLQEGQDYVFEFDITTGPYDNALMLAGVENSVISDLTWSDTAYNLVSDSSQEDKTDKFYEVNHDSIYQMYGAPGYPGLHRYHWDGGYWGMTTYGWKTKASPVTNSDGVYDFTDDSVWTVEPNWCSCMYGTHFISSGKNSRIQMNAGYKYVRFNINFTKFNTLSTGDIDGVEDYGALLGRENFNFFSMVHQNASYLFFDSDKVKEYGERNNSYVVDDNGEAATGVNIYDYDTGALVLGAMSNSSATGSVLSPNKKYVFEFDVEGEKNGSVVFCGIEDAKISGITWSDKLYSDRSGESAVADTLRILGNDTANHYLKKDEPLFHRLWKSSDGYTGNYLGNCVANADGEIETKSNRDTTGSANVERFNRCLTFAKKYWWASAKTSSQANRKYFRMVIEYNNFDTIDVGGPVTDESNPNYGTLAATYFNTFVYSPAGGRYLYLTAA